MQTPSSFYITLSLFLTVPVSVSFMQMTKLYSVIDHPYDYSIMQSALDELQRWSDKWQLNISYKKCNILQLDTKNNDPKTAMTLG